MNLHYISIIIVSLYILSLYISLITFKFIHTNYIFHPLLLKTSLYLSLQIIIIKIFYFFILNDFFNIFERTKIDKIGGGGGLCVGASRSSQLGKEYTGLRQVGDKWGFPFSLFGIPSVNPASKAKSSTK